MAKKSKLQASISAMAEGSKTAFHTFYSGTAQFVYRNASLLYTQHDEVCHFMVDFYQYLYLHIPEYSSSMELKVWISKLLRARYDELSIGKLQPDTSGPTQLNTNSSTLSEKDKEAIWLQLEAIMHFPDEDTLPQTTASYHIGVLPAVILILLLIFISVTFRFVPQLYERFHLSSITSNPSAAVSDVEDDSENETNDKKAADDEEDELTVQQLNELVEDAVRNSTSDTDSGNADLSNAESDDSAFDESQFQEPTMQHSNQTNSSNNSLKKNESKSDYTAKPNTSASDSGSNVNTSLDELELELRYGDDLMYPGTLGNR